jgi:hypothetical protein
MNMKNWGARKPKDQLPLLWRIIQEHQIKPMHMYVKKLDQAKEYLQIRFEQRIHELPEFQMQLLQYLQRPPISLELNVAPVSGQRFAVRFGSESGVQVKNRL